MDGLTGLSKSTAHGATPSRSRVSEVLGELQGNLSRVLWEVSEAERDTRHASTLDDKAAARRRLQAADSAALRLLQGLRNVR